MRWMPICSLLLCALMASSIAHSSSLTRDRDPVVLEGSDLPGLEGLAPASVVAFRFEGSWVQIPVQIDERDTVTFTQVYGGGYPQAEIDVETYTDAGTYVGADSDPTFDGDDELVFMAGDAGDAAPPAAGLPVGVVAGSGLQLRIVDSLDGGSGFVYLFRTDGSLAPDAGADYVSYDFELVAGSYPGDYDLGSGPNPETSTVVTPLYETEFSDRWIRYVTRVKAGSATQVDILDRHRNLFGPGVCGRSEDTFSDGEGAFFANIDGPVRAIRSYMGANSGPLTQRRHIFYRGRQDLSTFLRVHAIPGMLDLFDYSPAASGMTYYNSNNTSGVSVDGAPDTVTDGMPSWEMITGAQGTLIISGVIETDIGSLSITSYYDDNTDPSYTQCTGDVFEYGQSGVWITSGIPNTDPMVAGFASLTGSRIIYYDEPDQTVQDAAARSLQALTPLEVTATAFPYLVETPSLSPPALLLLAGLLAAAGAGVGLRARTETRTGCPPAAARPGGRRPSR
jgi:hypothetical protein